VAKLSKKIESILNNSIPSLIKRRMYLEEIYETNHAIELQLDKDLSDESQKLRYCSMRDLIKVKDKMGEELIRVIKELMDQQTKGEVDQELLEAQNRIEIATKLLLKTIENKREYQQHFTHPVERNIIEHGVFSSTTPTEKTLAKMRTKEGSLEQTRNGFRKLYYKNENGSLLTTYDTKVFIGILKLWEIKGRNSIVSFKFTDLLKEIESDITGGDYKALEKSLYNLATTSIIMEEFKDPHSKKRVKTKIHNPIINAEINHEYGTAEAKMELNPYIHQSLLAGNYIKINMGLFNDLARPISKNLYIFIVNKVPDDERIIPIDPLIEHLGVQGSTRTKCVNAIEDAFQELKDFNVIKDFKLIKKGRFYTEFSFVPSDWLNKQAIVSSIENTEITFLDH
jgi:predicted transcriptional regulator